MGLFSRVVVGLDIGHSSVKAVGVALGRKPRIVGFAEVSVDSKHLSKEGFSEHEVIVEAVKQAMREAKPHRIATSEVYAGIPEGVVFRKILELPATVSAEELPNVIRAESVEYLPDDIDKLEVDYQPLGSLSIGTQQVMVVAVPKKIVEDYLAVASGAKLKLTALDPKPSCVGRSVVMPTESDPVVLVDIGAERTSISIYANHMVWVTGSVNIGADVMKDENGQRVANEAKLTGLADGIVDELTHVLKFYQNRATQEGAKEIKEIRLCGGGSLTEGIVEAVRKQVKQKVVLARPVVPMPEGADARFYSALGSALYPLCASL